MAGIVSQLTQVIARKMVTMPGATNGGEAMTIAAGRVTRYSRNNAEWNQSLTS
jgi:hypothetical protein